MTGPRMVSAEFTAVLADPGPAVPLTVTLSYCDDDPYAVMASFATGAGLPPVEWFFARGILAAAPGLRGPGGDGDVRAWTDEAGKLLSLELNSPYGRAVFECPASDVAGFVDRSYQLVPEGAESIDVDAELAGLLQRGGEAR